MLKHAEIWRAIDRLAETSGLSTSGLAREAGLDATTFNKSKRIAPDGKKRWPSTESLAKILQATDTDLDSFVGLVSKTATISKIPVITQADLTKKNRFDSDGNVTGTGWGKIRFPGIAYEDAFAVILGKGAEPIFRAGDMLVFARSAELRKGDRIMALAENGEMILRSFVKEAAGKIELAPLSGTGASRKLASQSVHILAKLILIQPA